MNIYIHNYDVGTEAMPTPIMTLLLLPHDNYIYVAKAVHVAFHKTGPICEYVITDAIRLD